VGVRWSQPISTTACGLPRPSFAKRAASPPTNSPRRELLSIDRKGAQDLVSEADRVCEDLIVAGRFQLFPEDGFLGEELGSRNPKAAAIWVVDPIDGTHNFLTGIPVWCVSLGLVVGGELVLGIIYHPIAGELYSARA
jgi:myo-inositol-1(or 4)-monophosphatase